MMLFLYWFVLLLARIFTTHVAETPWLIGPCINVSDFYEAKDYMLFEDTVLTECLIACTSLDASLRSDIAIWNLSQNCLCLRNSHADAVLKLMEDSCVQIPKQTEDDVEYLDDRLFVLILRGPVIHDVYLGVDSASSEEDIGFKMEAVVRGRNHFWGSNPLLFLEVYWFLDGRLVNVDERISVGLHNGTKITSVWNTTLDVIQNSTIRVVLDTGLTTLSLVKRSAELLIPKVDFVSETERRPSCVPENYKRYKSLPVVFVDDTVRLVAKLSTSVVQKATFLWIFSSGLNLTTTSDFNSTMIHAFQREGVHTVQLTVSFHLFSFKYDFKILAVKEVYITYDPHWFSTTNKCDQMLSVPILATILSDEIWTFKLHCAPPIQSLSVSPISGNLSSCLVLPQNLSARFKQPGNYRCYVASTSDSKTMHFGPIKCQALAKVESVALVIKEVVATHSPTLMTVEILPKFDDWNFEVLWNIRDDNGATVFDSNGNDTTACDVVYTFRNPGFYTVKVTVSSPVSETFDEKSVLAQNPVTDVNVISPKPVVHVMVHSTVPFLAESIGGGGDVTEVQCLWKLRCLYSSSGKMLDYARDVRTCNASQKFPSAVSCSLSVTVFNRVSRLELVDRFRIFVEEPVSILHFHVPSRLMLKSEASVLVFVKNYHRDRAPVVVDIAVDSASLEVVYHTHLRAYEASLVPMHPGVQIVRLRAHNNVSSVIMRKQTLVVKGVGKVDLINVGCNSVGLPVRFLVHVDGKVPGLNETYLYHWYIQTDGESHLFYTSVPVAETKIHTQPDDVKVTVKVSNGVSSHSASIVEKVFESIQSPCMDHNVSFEQGQPVDFQILGVTPKLQLRNATMKIKQEKQRNFLSIGWMKSFGNDFGAIRWRYLSQSSGFHIVMGLLFFEHSDIVASKLLPESGFHVTQRLYSVRIYAPRTVYLSRFPISLTWRAELQPPRSEEGCVFHWKLHGYKYVTATPQLEVKVHYPPGTYKLELEARNALGSVKSSMVFEVATTLLLLNYTLSNFFARQNGSIALEINQAVPPDTLFVDFGDDTTYDSNVQHQLPVFSRATSNNDSSVITLYHTYHYAGLYDVYINMTGRSDEFEHWVSIVVEEKMSDPIEMVLLSPGPIVELLEEVTVSCLVRRGTNLRFRWDFGDGSDGEQYTRQETNLVDSFMTNSTAHHSYGIANSYNVSVHVANSYESVTVYLNVTIQAVEPIVELHIHPRVRGRYAAPLYKKKGNEAKDAPLYATSPIEFETGVWRGSDVQFLFQFGDGNAKLVSSLLNAWSHPYAIVKHSYKSEGIYDVSVTATNLLSSVNASLGQPFYVQFPPENLLLDKQYYIIEHHANVTLQASVSQGTNVSYNWRVGDRHMLDAGSALFLPKLNPGIYIVTIEAYNHVTDYGYNVIRRPNATAKIYVQERLLGILICLKVNSSEICDPGVLDLALDEEVQFTAKVIPSTETVLRFIWQLGVQDIHRTNIPVFVHKYQQAGWYSINVTAQNHISSIFSISLQLNLVQKIANLTSIFCQGPNLVNHPITYRALYWFGTNLTFLWDFGDGSSPVLTASSSVQHIYKEVGEYWVTVNVWNKFSHANITTNMFFLHHLCQKPEITFLHQRARVAIYDNDVLIEADISIVCKTDNVEYTWIVRDDSGSIVEFSSNEDSNRRQLVIPKKALRPGTYTIHLKVSMVGTIVYAESSTHLELALPQPFMYAEGGFVHWVGTNDSQKVTATIVNLEKGNLRYIWSCVPQIQKYLPCFTDSEILSNHSPELIIPTSAITPNLGSIILNISIENNKLLSATQLLEIKQTPHMLPISIECEECHDHHVNQHQKLQMKVSCRNCSNPNLEYHWKIWIIEDFKFQLHFGNYECVQADGSTFFIVAPNTTQEENLLNATYLSNRDLKTFVNVSNDHMLAEKPYDASVEDLPPFPTLPGFPEENNTTQGQKLSRNTRNTLDEELFEFPDILPLPDYPFEGDADYDDSSNFTDFPYPDFMPFPVPDSPLEGPDYLITEEGLPGESGSAAARHQSSQNLGIILTEDEDQILEEAGKPRMKTSGTNSVLNPNSNDRGDPLRDRLNRKYPSPHIVSRPRGLLTLSDDVTTTGFNSDYLILKPGILKVGRTYLVQAKVSNPENGEEGFAMEYFKVNVGPINGRCTLMPVDGYSINFDFRLHCLEWKSDHLPLYYELSYSRNPEEVGHLIYFGLNGNVKFNLPSGFSTDSHNVYLNVIVRDNLGVPTKVCSIIRRVKPVPADITVEHIVFNETFNTKANLKKLIGEKNNQGILQKLHVLASSLNNYESLINVSELETEMISIRSRIRQEFFAIANSLRIYSKVESMQLMSVLNAVITDVQTIKLFELQKAYNIYKKVTEIQSRISNFFISDRMHLEFVNFLSKLAFAAHSIHPRNDELIAICRAEVVHEMNKSLKRRLKVEEPFKINIPHLSTAAFYVTEVELLSKSFIFLKSTAVQLLDNSYFSAKFNKETAKNYSQDECPTFVMQEYDYISSSSRPHVSDFFEAARSSVLLSLNSFSGLEDKNNDTLNVSVHFFRENPLEKRSKILLKRSFMNLHIINITEMHIGHFFLFYMKLDSINITEERKDVIYVMFRHLHHPTLTRYDLKRSFLASTPEIDVLISPDKIKVPGLYYISVLSNSFLERKTTQTMMWEYEASLWKDVCLGKVSGFWSAHVCHVLQTTNHNSTHCKCSSKEITALSAPVEWKFSLIPISDLIEPYFNPLPLLVCITLFTIYFVLLYLNLKKDSVRNLMCSPIPLKDNSTKHKQLYLVCVKTGFYFSSGSTASVFVVLHGTKDVTETRQLIGKNAKKYCFQKGSVDVFLLSTERNLGPLLKLEVWHDNEGISPSWYLKTISVKDLNTGASYSFNCYNWLSAERVDGQIERELGVEENPLGFINALYENFVAFIYDFNMWNALIMESPTSIFTGVQRITCCLCFILNCGSLISFFINMSQEIGEDDALPHITLSTFLISITTALVASIPQVFYTVIFRFSNLPFINVNPKFVDVFYWLSPYSFNCWLRHKRSTSSHSTDDRSSSSSMAGSDSLYSSFEDSSIMSVPGVTEESFSFEEKDNLPLSFSYSDLSDPVSPLQNTLSTWQTLENWLKKRHNLILNPDVIPMKRHSYVSQNSCGELEGNSLTSDQDVEVDSQQTWQQNTSSLQNSSKGGGIEPRVCEDINKELDLNCFIPCLHYSFYYFSWLILMINLLGSTIFILIKSSRFSIPYSILFFKNILISAICSCLCITPFLILLLSLFYSIHAYSTRGKPSPPAPPKSPDKVKKLHKVDFNSSSYSRIEYFKKYLRPPKEQVLEQFRQVALQENRICNFYSDLWNFVIVLFLLLAVAYPVNIHERYLQRSSIRNALFRSIPKTTKTLSSKYSLHSWLEADFLDGFFVEHQCLYADDDCGMSTKCIFVGSIILRHFYNSKCSSLNSVCATLVGNASFLSDSVYERRSLIGHYSSYYEESEWQILSDQNFYVYDEIHDFIEKMNASSAASVEFLLFNPTFSLFTSVSLLFEVTSLGVIAMSFEILPVVISGNSDTSHYLKLLFNLILFIFVLFSSKKHIWKMTKHKSQYWRQMCNYWSCLFIFTYFIYLTFFVLYVITCEKVALNLSRFQLSSNMNLTIVAALENYSCILMGFLLLLHLVGCLKVLSFSLRLKKMLRRLCDSQKKICVITITFFLVLLPFTILIKNFIGTSSSFSHPLFGFVRIIMSLFKDYEKPDVTHGESPFRQFLSICISLILICVHMFLFSIIRSVFLNSKHVDDNCKTKNIVLKKTKKVFKKKILAQFKHCSPQTLSRVEHVPPVDILLFELERIADVLVTKVNSLFPDDNENCENDLKSECGNFNRDKLESRSELIPDAFEEGELKLYDFNLGERLISTIPRQTKGNLNAFMLSSFHASLGSEKKYKTSEMSSSVLQNRIRKTYPLSHLDSDSTSSETPSHPDDDKLDSVNSLLVRKTKSRGKNEDFELNVKTSDHDMV